MTRLRTELLDELLSDCETPEDLLGEEGLFKQLKKALLERAPAPETIIAPSWPPGSATLRLSSSLAEKPSMH